MVERWKPVLGYEDLYQVSDRGRVRRIARGPHTHVGLILRPRNGGRGYPIVDLYRNSHAKTRKVHTLVTEAFFGPCPAGLEVNHKNGIKEDNRVSNLGYVTHRENIQHSYDVLGRKGSGGGPCGEAHGRAKLTDVIVGEIRRLYVKGGVTQRGLAKRYGVSQGCINGILNRRKWTHVA